MAQTSIHICPVKGGSELHNERRKVLDYVRAEFSPKNQTWKSPDFPGIDEQHTKINADYQAAHGKKMHAKATPIREAVVVIQKDTTMQQLLNACAKCREKFGIEAMQIYTHKDEGHTAEDGSWKPNLHAHIIFNWYSSNTHTTHKLSRQDMSEMQTIFAECLQMQRGVSSDKKHLSAIQQKNKAETNKAQKIKENVDLLLGFSNQFEDALKKVARAQKILASIDYAISQNKLKRSYPPSDGFCRVEDNDGKFNFVNLETGELITKNEWFYYANDFIKGFATIMRNGITAKINTSGIAIEIFKNDISKANPNGIR